MKKKLIYTFALTLGDPNGIGAEISAKALYQLSKKNMPFEFVVLGSKEAFEKSCNLLKIPKKIRNIVEFKDFDSVPHNFNSKPSKEGGIISYQAIKAAANLYKDKKVDAIITAPISKKSLHLANYFYDGHTGLLADIFNIENPYLMLANKRFSTIHVTCHLSLKEAINKISYDNVLNTILIGNDHMKKIGLRSPRLGVCGLNPHAGENGIFGNEEIEYIIPAIEKAKKKGLNIKGPISSDIIFREALINKFDLVVANFHDQGHIPVKLLFFDQSVNVTLGVPFIRTSVDHGTAFDIAYQNKAKHWNMVSAIFYAYKMSKIKSFKALL